MISPISSAVHALGQSASIGGVGSLSPTSTHNSTDKTGFGSALQGAIGSLENAQTSASTAAQGLATGTISDPTQAVTAVENASLAMDMASQISNKLVTDVNTIFQTQI